MASARKQAAWLGLRHLTLMVIAFLMLVPFYWVIKTAITNENIYAYPPNLLPGEIMTDDPRRVRALWVDSANPWATGADTAAVKAEAAKLAAPSAKAIRTCAPRSATSATRLIASANSATPMVATAVCSIGNSCRYFGNSVSNNRVVLRRPPVLTPSSRSSPTASPAPSAK